jgi:hypothetical protein
LSNVNKIMMVRNDINSIAGLFDALS